MKLWLLAGAAALIAAAQPLPKDEGYRGIWYWNTIQKDQYKYKYSGGLGTYPQQLGPIAVYSKKANKTFFCYGGTVKGKQELLNMVSYYDHSTGKVPRPTILLNKKTNDAHDNASLTMDDEGYLWVFANAHGTSRPAYIYKSKQPYSVEDFERVVDTNFSYSHAWHISGKGFLVPHTLYRDGGRSLFWMTSKDGQTWDEPQPLARIENGHYQMTWRDGSRVGSAFNLHPKIGGNDARTNLYYIETRDMGKTWRTVDGKPLKTPLTEVHIPALVHDYQVEKLLVYLKDIQFDSTGRPVLVYLTSKGSQTGPVNDPRTLYTARWTGSEWTILPITTTDHNYDYGSIYIESGGMWRFIAATAPGPQPYGTGGDIVMWTSRDQGRTWSSKPLTHKSRFNHTYPRRPVNAHPDFYALWADGDPFAPSESSLYFTNKAGSGVWRLPVVMKQDFEKPQRVK